MPYNKDGSKKKNPTKRDWAKYRASKKPKKRPTAQEKFYYSTGPKKKPRKRK